MYVYSFTCKLHHTFLYPVSVQQMAPPLIELADIWLQLLVVILRYSNWSDGLCVVQQAALIKASPKLLFRVHDRHYGRNHMLLMASDYERATWRTAIRDLLGRGAYNTTGCSIISIEKKTLKKSRFWATSRFLGDDTLYGHSYCGTLIGTPVRSIKQCHLQWPWVIPTQISRGRRYTTLSISKTVQDRDAVPMEY